MIKIGNSISNTKTNNKVAIVTGSSSGIGFEIALLLARNGFHTYATIRNPEKSKQSVVNVANPEKLPLQVMQLDVTNDKSIKKAIGKPTTKQERIDVLFHNAGYLLLGTVEELSIKEFREQFETNFLDVIRVTQSILPIMKRQGAGTIINIRSIAGMMGFPLS